MSAPTPADRAWAEEQFGDVGADQKVEQQQGPPEDIAELRAAAAPALRHLRPLELFEESCRAMGLGGNLALATTIYLAATTRVLGRRMRLHAHSFVLGPASSGKSFEMEAALEHLPPEAVVAFDGSSPRALIYSDRDIRHRVLVYSEMDSLPMGNGEDDAANTALSYLRTLVVNGIASYDVTVKSKDGFTTRRYTKEGPTTLLVTGTRRLGDEQLASRLHEVEVTVDRERLRSVIDAQGRLLQGGKSRGPAEAVIAMQAYLQALAPIEVTIPFAGALGRAIIAKAKLTDPRLTREFPRIAGFAAAHALLSIERREWAEDGSVVATLEDYAAASSVIRELSTSREFSRFAIEVWSVVNAIYKETSKPVTVGQVSKSMLKDHSGVRKTMNTLLQGGALLDARERPSRTAPILVVPSGDSPCRILLPTKEELLEGCPPPDPCPKRHQVDTAQRDNLGSQAGHSGSQVKPMNREDLTPLGTKTPGGIEQEEAPDPDVYRHHGADYKVGDQLPDGRLLESIEFGIPVFVRPRRTGDGLETVVRL